ncbi:MAG: anthranilate phosphoribosyltransferase, partial [Cyclobacteriaceae bacterium]|nr:anthranilate phosphoribosyltransferase [Cyclobacteriaceae bacterium]
SPGDLGFEKLSPESLYAGGTIEESAEIFLKVLKNEATEAQINVTLANAALGLIASKNVNSFVEGLEAARDSLDSGKALKAFENFLRIGGK